MRKDTDEEVRHGAKSSADAFIEVHGKTLDDEQKAALYAEIYPIAMREELETREAVAHTGYSAHSPTTSVCRVWHRSFRDMSAVAAKYGIDTGFEKISKNWQF